MWLTAADLSRRAPADCANALVIGDEPLLVEESADRLRAAVRERGYGERIVFEAGAGFDWQSLASEGSAMSLFSERRLIELRLPEAKPGAEGGKALQAFVAAQVPDTILLVIAPTSAAPPKDAAWMQRLTEGGVGVRCRRLRHEQLPGWLAQRARSLKLEIDEAALRWLASQVEGNLLAARQELEKLPLLGEGRWDLPRLQAVVSDHARYAGYELPDILLSGDLAGGLRMLARLREEATPPVMLLASLARDLRSLHQAARRSGALGPDRACEAAGIWRSRKPQFMAALRRLGLTEIQGLHLAVVALDRTAKSLPEARFWEDLINFSVRIAGGRQSMAARA